MTTEMRRTGVDVVGDMPWGTHFCLFYETHADLLETLVSYCKAGLESQEFCLWVVAEPLTVEDAKRALQRAVPDFNRYFADHSIEIVPARDWYLHDGTFNLDRVIGGWNEKLTRASAKGYTGVRVTGDTAWLEKKDWKDFCEYEESLNQAVANRRLAVLCTYPLAACGAAEILDVVRTHQFAVTKRRGTWDVIETAGHKQAKAEIKRLNEELEQRVVERTSQLTALNSELTKEVLERQRAEALRDGESRILEMIVRDAALEEILENLVRVVEAQFSGLLCSVLLLDEDGQRARHGAAPNLPKPYTEAIDGLCIGPKAGSCGTAMYRGESVVVTDILQDPLWEPYRDLVEPYGFRACWSTPIFAHSGKALGSFAMYYREPRSPSPAETQALEMATHLGGIAIERKLAREERERLRRAQADLAHINRVTTMGELTASLAHEIKQPITAAAINAKTCLRWLERDAPDLPEAREAASRLVTDVTRAADIISRITFLFKKDTLQREWVDVEQLIREMIVLLRTEAARCSISIRSDLAKDLPRVMADRIQLQQVLMNLMLNGIEAMKDMGAPGELTIKSRQDENGHLLISVSDTGVGLPAKQADQIFNAFFTTKVQGTGMGLSISRSIVESHGGRLWAADNSPRGASFYLSLPTKVEAHK
jgi:C4-dicarboxylate-specific signal transduction histidine kinase